MTEDNEKRIFVQEIIICRKPKSKDIYKCSCFNNPFSGYLVCRAHPDYREGITRDEAVERMAKAMCIATGFDVCSECKKRKDVNCLTRLRRNGHIMRAKAALDALINSQDNDHVDDQKRITDGD